MPVWVLRDNLGMVDFFTADPELVRWDLRQIESDGRCRLTVHHANGVIVEEFPTVAMALGRMQRLDDVLARVRKTGDAVVAS